MKTAIYRFCLKDGLFAKEKPDWDSFEKMANTISDTEIMKEYRERIMKAKTNQTLDAEINLIHDPIAIANVALRQTCGAQLVMDPPFKVLLAKEIRLAAAQAFRHQYFSMWDYSPLSEENKRNPEYQKILKDIDHTLCTLPECADLRDGIEGLDCKPYAALVHKSKYCSVINELKI